MSGMYANHYRETEEALRRDPAILGMVADLGEMQDEDALRAAGMIHPAGHPTHQFMMAALHEYQDRGGSIPTHIGGPANAIIALLKEPRPEVKWVGSAELAEQAEALGLKTRDIMAARRRPAFWIVLFTDPADRPDDPDTPIWCARLDRDGEGLLREKNRRKVGTLGEFTDLLGPA